VRLISLFLIMLIPLFPLEARDPFLPPPPPEKNPFSSLVYVGYGEHNGKRFAVFEEGGTGIVLKKGDCIRMYCLSSITSETAVFRKGKEVIILRRER
jgi:hypothetical protein